MTTLDTLITTLRGMLNADHINLMSVFSTVETWPLDAQRAVAFHYLQGYVEQHLPDRVNQTRAPRAEHMILDATSGILYDHDGSPLKQLQCSLNACWQNMAPIKGHDDQRHCGSCQKRVFNTKGMTGSQVRALLKEDPSRCLHIDERDGHVRIVYPPPKDRGTRSINTVYTEHEMNLAVGLGLYPWVHTMRRQLWGNDDTFQFLQVWRHPKTAQVYFQTDMRQPPPDDAWLPALYDISYPPEHYAVPPVAAYLLPRDLTVGERVYVRQPIELLFQFDGLATFSRPNYATWTGQGFDFEREPDDRIFWVG